MKSNISLCYPIQQTPRSVLKKLFLELLNETERKCKLICKNTYDQERYFMISVHPEINQKKASIDKAKERVLLESGAMHDDKDELFYKYAFGLCQLKFNFLFMKIFTGKINKHWLPVAAKYNLSAQPNLNDLVLLKDLLEKFKNVSYDMDNKTLSKIISLSKSKIIILEKIIPLLIEANLLNQKTLNDFIDILTTQLPKINSETVIEDTNDDHNENNIRKLKLSNDFTFFMKKDNSSIAGSGGQGYVHKGYDKEVNMNEPVFSVKHFFYHSMDKNLNKFQVTSKMARKEVKYNKLLGRDAFHYFHENKNCMIAPWASGKDLSNYRNDITSYPFERRLHWLKSMLCDLNTLHSNFRIHGDLKPENMILDTAKNTLKLIDFGSSHRAGLWKAHYSLVSYIDNNTKSLFSPDIRVVCQIITILYPELFERKNHVYQPRVSTNQVKDYVQQVIINLFESLNYKDANKRCTIKDALEFISQILSQFNLLNTELLKTLEINTINRDQITFEDAIHGRTSTR